MPNVVEGRVVDARHRPVAEASVAIVAGPGPAPDIAALSDQAGHFSLGSLAPGWWRIRAFAPDGTRGEVVVELPQTKAIEIVVDELSTPESN